MKTISNLAALILFLGVLVSPVGARPLSLPRTSAQQQSPVSAKQANGSSDVDAYYYFTLGHIQEQQFELTSGTGGSGLADQSIASYKKALDLDPNSSVIQERLAEIYAKSQHIRDA